MIEPNPAGGADLAANYAYNAAGQLTRVSMTRGTATQTWTFAYNAQLRLQSSANPKSSTAA